MSLYLAKAIALASCRKGIETVQLAGHLSVRVPCLIESRHRRMNGFIKPQTRANVPLFSQPVAE